jgi:hypothetical protein
MNIKKVVYLTTYLNKNLSEKVGLPYYPAGLKKKDQLLEILKVDYFSTDIIFVTSFSRFHKFYSKPFKAKVNTHNIYFPFFFYFPFLNYIINPIFVLIKLLRLNRTKKIDYLVLYNTVFENVIVAFIFKKLLRKNVKIIIQYEDSFIYNTKGIKKYLNIFSHKLAEYIANGAIINSNNLRRVFKNKFYFLFRGILNPISKNNNLIKPFPLLNVLFTTNIDSIRGIDLLIDFFNNIKFSENLLHLNFQITGHGNIEKINELEDSISEYRNRGGKAKYLGFVSVDELSNLYDQAHILLALQNPELKFSEFCFPSKIIEYYNYNKPIITTNISDLSSDDFFNLEFIDYNIQSLLYSLIDHYNNYEYYLKLNKFNSKKMLNNISKEKSISGVYNFLNIIFNE